MNKSILPVKYFKSYNVIVNSYISGAWLSIMYSGSRDQAMVGLTSCYSQGSMAGDSIREVTQVNQPASPNSSQADTKDLAWSTSEQWAGYCPRPARGTMLNLICSILPDEAGPTSDQCGANVSAVGPTFIRRVVSSGMRCLQGGHTPRLGGTEGG